MAQLDKLMVSGIRSFGPEDENRGMIKFYPLTLILGKNGAGKTSLIEALRYMASGDHPPGTNAGKTWVHNPQTAKSSTVRAQVKLKFNDAHGVETITTRSMEMTMKKDKNGVVKPTLRSMDGIIKRGNATLPTRCAEVDKEMLELLGASKAVMTNVIFCHQEDNTWPLSEGKVLKEKFDQIFGSIGYVKALAKIKKVRDDKVKEQKNLKTTETLHYEYKTTLDKHRKRLKNQKEIMEEERQCKKELEAKLKPLEEELNQIARNSQEMNEVNRKVSEIQGKLHEKVKSFDALRKKVSNLFDGTVDEIEEEIASFKQQSKALAGELQQNQTKAALKEKSIKSLSSELDSLSTNKGKLEQLEEQYKANLTGRQTSVAFIYDDGLIDGAAPPNAGSVDNKLVAKTYRLLENKNKALTTALLTEVESIEGEIRKMDIELDHAKASKVKLEQAKQIKKDNKKKKIREVGDLKLQLAQIDESSSQSDELMKQLDSCQRELDSINASFNPQKFDRQIEKVNANKKELHSKKESLNDRLVKIQMQAKQRAEYERLLEAKKKEKLVIATIQEHQQGVIKAISLKLNKSFHETLKLKEDALKQKLDKNNSELSRMNVKVVSTEDIIKAENQNLKKLRSEVSSDNAKIQTVLTQSQSIDALVDTTEAELAALRDKHGCATGTSYLVRQYMSGISDHDACPVCHREFEQDEEDVKSDALKGLSEYLTSLPQQMSVTKATIEQKEEYLARLREVKPLSDSLENKKQSIVQLETKIEANTKILNELKPSLSQLKVLVTEQESELQKLRSAVPHAIQYDRANEDLDRIEEQISKVSNSFENGDSFKTPEEVMAEIQSVDAQVAALDQRRDTINQERNDLSQAKNKLQEQMNELQADKLSLERNQQQRTGLVMKIEDLKKEIEAIDDSDGSEDSDLKQALTEISHLEKEKTGKTYDKEVCRKNYQTKIEAIRSNLEKLDNLNSSIEAYERSGRKNELAKLVSRVTEIKKNVADLEDDRDSLNNKIKKQQSDISNEKVKERELEDNLHLMEIKAEMDRLNTELIEVESSISQSDYVKLENRRIFVEKEHHKLVGELGKVTGKMGNIQDQQKETEKEMQRSEIKNSEKSYKKAVIEHLTIDILCDDLNKYYKALDKAVSTYHVRKMHEINKLIDHFWKQTYQSADIETIKIVCDDSEERAADKRKTFNYRVVMVRGGIEMDMRGRCSAGQKVLASLVIRIALAQIFCIKCGVLALDEPTTNLDEANIRSLAKAISNIADDQQGKMQLIIISHDPEFLKCLTEENEYYYEVWKDEDGLSRIKRCSIRERE